MPAATLTVRHARVQDAAAIAEIRAASWRAAYAGLLPDALLQTLDPRREAQLRAARWERNAADPRRAQLVAQIADEPIGWASTGPSRDRDATPRRGELYTIYVHPDAWGRGAGRLLIHRAEHALSSAGFTTGMLWMLSANARAAAFYDRVGWLSDGRVKHDDALTARLGLPPLREERRVRTLRADGPAPCRAERDADVRPAASRTSGRPGSGRPAP